jgi:two-component system LytT family response regulator
VKAFLVDDERLARNELRRLLASHPDVVVAGDAGDVHEAEAWLRDNPVDVLFLDIEMPGGSGFELLERLESVPAVIFTTAYDEYAVRAFEVNALDYLLKPVAPERLAAALERVRQAGMRTLPPSTQSSPAPASPLMDRVFVREGDRCWIVRLADIRLLESEGNYTRLFFGAERPLIPRSLQALETRLDPALFFRASRQQIINLRWVVDLEAEVDGGLLATLRDGPTVKVSRRRARLLREGRSL